MSVNEQVQERYSAAAQSFEQALCCPIADYDSSLLAAIPNEVLERDYGCGAPSRFVKAGDVVLDLGSGGGKICFIASQIVGAQGKVIGVDRNREMLDLAERSAPIVAEKTGINNVAFAVGNIQDLALDLLQLEAWLAENPVKKREDVFAMEAEQKRLRKESPLIADDSIDIVLSNCVLNLVDEQDRHAMFKELFRVCKVGGRVAISDIVCDQQVPQELKDDAE
ncbi:MAG: methyltransferase domain-containing protein, partial [Planctomycetes bacterium]|nr:methyltransferase domain-containing protein [Planctomycetota bacterium]